MGWRASLNFNGWQPTTAPWNELKQILTARKDGQPTINDMKKTKLTIIRSRKWKNFYSPLTISWRREGDNVFEYCKSEGYWRQSKFSVSKLKAKAFTNGLLIEDDIQEGLSYAPNGLHLKA